MAYAPTTIPAAAAVDVDATETTITVPANFKMQLGVLLLQRSTDSNSIYWGLATGVTTATGVLVSKGAPGSTFQYLIPKELFEAQRVIYVISGGANQILDVVIV